MIKENQMKLLAKISMSALALAMLAYTPAAQARLGGGIGDGGGHGFSSTPEEVRAYLLTPSPRKGQFVYDWESVHQHLDAWLLLSPDYAPNPVIQKILAAMQKAYVKGSSNTAYAAIENMPLAVSDACYDHDGALSDGATTIGKLGAPMCLNANSLARYPSSELKQELLALIYHEWTHQLGFGEPEAVEMQNYVRHLLPTVLAMLNEASGEIPIRVGGSRTMVAQDGTSVTILCTTPEIWEKSEKGGVIFKSTSTILFVGQSMKVRGQWCGDVSVACSDLPQFNCNVKPSTDNYCVGSYVYFGGGDNGVCVGHYNDAAENGGQNEPTEYKNLQELKDAKICR